LPDFQAVVHSCWWRGISRVSAALHGQETGAYW